MLTKDRMISLMDKLLDWMIEMIGVKGAIQWLFDSNLTENDLVELGFDEIDIQEALNDE